MTTHAHGINGYRKRGCKCPICTEAHKMAQRRHRLRVRLRESVPSRVEQPAPAQWAGWSFDIQAAIDRAADAIHPAPTPRPSGRINHH